MRLAKIITIHLGLFALGIIPHSLLAQSSSDENSAVVQKHTPSKDIQAYQIYTAKGKISYAQYIEMMGSSIEKQGENGSSRYGNPLWGISRQPHFSLATNANHARCLQRNEGRIGRNRPGNKSGGQENMKGQAIAVPLALGAEMFETDQQTALNEYLNPSDTITKTETMVTPMGAMMGGDPQYDKLKKPSNCGPISKPITSHW